MSKPISIDIAICDDDSIHINIVSEMLIKYGIQNDINFKLIPFTNPEDLLASTADYKILFLDILLENEKNGIDVGIELRQKGSQCIIIYLTSSIEYSLDGYKVEAFRYILKPISYNEVEDTMDKCVNILSDANETIMISADKQTYLIQCRDIVAIESCKSMHKCNVYIHNNLLTTRESLSSLYLQLSDSYFQYIQKGYVVNLQHVIRFTSNEITISNGTILPLSRNYKQAFMDALHLHMRKNG